MKKLVNSSLRYTGPKQNVFFLAEVTDSQPSPSASGEHGIGKGPYDPQAGPFACPHLGLPAPVPNHPGLGSGLSIN